MKSQGNHNTRSFLMGVLTTLLLLGLSVPALAAAAKTIDVSTGINIYIDDVKLNPTDVAGNPVEPFLYNGTTYLPVRAISEALGKVVQWDGSTRSVYIGKHSSDTPAAYLASMDDFSSSGYWETDVLTKDNLGTDHTHSLKMSYTSSTGSITYKLNGQFSRLTAAYFVQYDYRSAGGVSPTLTISGDGKQLWQGTTGIGVDHVDIDLDITGVLELTIEYPQGTGNSYQAALGDIALWT